MASDLLDLIHLRPLMERTTGRPEILIGLIDGPVALDHSELNTRSIREIPTTGGGRCTRTGSAACSHGTFVAGILTAHRGSAAAAICPDCTLLIRPIFTEEVGLNGNLPSATPEQLSQAIFDCIKAGAHLINISAGIAQPSLRSERSLADALDEAVRRGIVVVAAAGNQRSLGSTTITRHPWVVPVAAYDLQGRPIGQSNLGVSIGRRGIGAPGEAITSLGSEGKPLTLGGTSAATPFVTGTLALLWSEFPRATATQIKFAVTELNVKRRLTVVPPLINAWAAYQRMRRWFQ
ncbi:MAG TPA: S8 family serine peptidase [Acidobacteriota bacterium]|nr:S8 family serine peptidase [Acidobacteriota bacterium]